MKDDDLFYYVNEFYTKVGLKFTTTEDEMYDSVRNNLAPLKEMGLVNEDLVYLIYGILASLIRDQLLIQEARNLH